MRAPAAVYRPNVWLTELIVVATLALVSCLRRDTTLTAAATRISPDTLYDDAMARTLSLALP
jgi:hypothetical protein